MSAATGPASAAHDGDAGPYLELHYRPNNLPMVSSVRRFLSDFVALELHDRVTSERIALVAHELLENAVKY